MPNLLQILDLLFSYENKTAKKLQLGKSNANFFLKYLDFEIFLAIFCRQICEYRTLI